MRKISIGICGTLIAIGIFVICKAMTFPGASNGALGPGFFPIALACIVIILAGIQIYNSVKCPSEEEKTPVNLLSAQSVRVWITIGATIAYFILMEYFGFLITTPIYLFFLVVFFKVKSWVTRIAVPIATTAVIYIVFTMFLYVQLPSGSLL